MRVAAALLAVCSGALLAAQDVATIARFLDPDGKPIADAEVVFATTTAGVGDAFAPAHVVRGKTDASGRCRVLLRPGAAHSAWAIGPAGEGGRWRTRVAEGVVAGNVLELVAAERSAMKPLVVPGLEEFGAGPFRLELRCNAQHGPVWSFDLAQDGKVVLPELPMGARCGRLFDRGGRVVVASMRCSDEIATFGDPQRVTVDVVDADGKPVAGARVGMVAATWFGYGDDVFRSARESDCLIEGPPTDAAGRSVFAVADGDQAFIAWTGDRYCRAARVGVQRIVDGELIVGPAGEPKPGEAVRLVLREGPVLRGTLRRGDRPLAAHGVLATTIVCCQHVEAGSSSSTSFQVTQSARTDANGAFAIAGVPRPIGVLRLALDALPEGDDVPTLLLPRADVPAEPLAIDVAAWPELTWQLMGDGPAPPSGVRFLVWPAGLDEYGVPPLVLVGDRMARVRVRLEPGAWFVVATDVEGIAAKVLHVTAGPARTVELKPSPLAHMTGRAVHADGSAAAGLAFACNGWSARNEPENEPEDARLLRRYQDLINRGVIARARTDAQGRFDVRFLALPGRNPDGVLGAMLAQVQYRAATDVVITCEK